MELIGIRIANLRKEKEYTLAETAKGIISVSYLNNIEKCRKVPSLETLLFLAERYDIAEDFLVLETNNEVKLLADLQQIYKDLMEFSTHKALDKLKRLESKYVMAKEKTYLELIFYCLLSAVYYRIWKEDAAIKIEERKLFQLRKIKQTKLPAFLQTAFNYFQLQKNFFNGDYKKANACLEILEQSTIKATYKAVYFLTIAISCICLEDYEQADHALNQAKQYSCRLPAEKQENLMQICYLEGFVQFEIGFYKKAKQKLQEADSYGEQFSNMKKRFSLSIHFKLLEVYEKLNEKAKFGIQLQKVYQIVLEKGGQFDNNDRIVLPKLLVYFAENECFEEYAVVKNLIIQGEKDSFFEMKFFWQYAEALEKYERSDFIGYEKLMAELLQEIDTCNDPRLIRKTKEHASNYYASHKKYKNAFQILKG
ncbi:helix-turn-helix domain-containing protein [Listeria grayi]|uniref:helix-turn-helix domain-containing protein n=1 Tax=Listeria grayi TaxID=1641 RepID=UPI001624F999|nr:helix-turn-helix transcriptional regulator [Listeria grayi]MBC1921916.1 helix-turn-helix transcriptional regulator [Listeria grayi]